MEEGLHGEGLHGGDRPLLLRYGQLVVSMHPTGMDSCSIQI